MDAKAQRIWKRILVGELSAKRLVKSVAFIYGSLCLFAVFGTNRLLFQPHASSYAGDASLLRLTAEGGVSIAARWIENPSAERVLLFSHGNAEDIGDLQPFFEELKALGFSVMAYEYEGYGESAGKPSERRLYADIDAAYAYLTVERKIPPGNILAYGRSLGGGPSVDLASRKPLGGLILENTFTSVYRVVTRISLFPGDPFRNLEKMAQVRCPVLVMHGTADRVIPFRHGEALFAAASEPKRSLWVTGAGHGEVPWADVAGFDQALREMAVLGERR